MNRDVLAQLQPIFQEFLTSHELYEKITEQQRPNLLLVHQEAILNQALLNCGLQNEKSLSAAQLALIKQELAQIVYINSHLPSFIENGDAMEQLPPPERGVEATNAILAKNLLRHLFRGTSLCTQDGQIHTQSPLVDQNSTLVDNLFKEINPLLLEQLRVQMKEMLHRSFDWLQLGQYTQADLMQYQIFQAHLFAAFTFVDPQPNTKIFIPQYIDNNWVNVPYTVKRYDISPQSGPLSWVLQDEDRMYAYAYEPDREKFPSADAHLSLMGSTYPAGQGRGIANTYNFVPGYAVGEAHDMRHVEAWLKEQPKKSVKVTGHSKGAVQAQIMAGRFPTIIKEANCLNPTALPVSTLKRIVPEYEKIPQASRPIINVYAQQGDPVFPFEMYFLPGTRVLRVLPAHTNPIMNCRLGLRIPLLGYVIPIAIPEILRKTYQAHINFYAGWSQVLMLNTNLEHEHNTNQRIYLTTLKSLLNYLVFPVNYAELFIRICARRVNDLYEEYWFCIYLASILITGLAIGLIMCLTPFALPLLLALIPLVGSFTPAVAALSVIPFSLLALPVLHLITHILMPAIFNAGIELYGLCANLLVLTLGSLYAGLKIAAFKVSEALHCENDEPPVEEVNKTSSYPSYSLGNRFFDNLNVDERDSGLSQDLYNQSQNA